MSKARPPTKPAAAGATARQRLLDALAIGPMSPREASRRAGISERDLAEHLEHLEKSLKARGQKLLFTRPVCRTCGFTFSERSRFTRPSKCPRCGKERIEPATWWVDEDGP